MVKQRKWLIQPQENLQLSHGEVSATGVLHLKWNTVFRF